MFALTAMPALDNLRRDPRDGLRALIDRPEQIVNLYLYQPAFAFASFSNRITKT